MELPYMALDRRGGSLEICKLLGTTMKTIILLLLLVACSEPVKYEETLIQVIAIEETATGCTYSVEAVVPYQPYIKTQIEEECGKYKVGDKITVRWIVN
jgi:hypothetical protein